MSDELETEVKFQVENLAPLRQRLLAAGGRQLDPRVLERNLRWDDPAGTLRRAGKVLRLRQDARARLTLKLPAGPWGSQAKTLRELEFEVTDFETARRMLNELGFHVWFVYEKYRETFELAQAEICLDELPFGSYIEIEGALDAIQAVADRLGLARAPRITAGYVTLFAQARERLQLPFSDCTFADWDRWQEGLVDRE